MQRQTDCPPISARTGSVSDVSAQVQVWILKPPPPPAPIAIKSPNVLDSCRESGTAGDCCSLAPSRSSPASTLASPQSRVSSLKSPQSPFGPSLDGLASSTPSVAQHSSGSSSSTGLPSIADTQYDSLTAAPSTDLSPTRPSTGLPSSSRRGREAFFIAELEFEIKNSKLPKKRLKLEAQKNNRVKRLATAVQGFTKVEEPPNEFYGEFWSVTSPIFDGSKAGSAPKGGFEAEAAWRLGQLERARNKILKNDNVTPRLWLVFYAHEIEHISLQGGLETSKGFGKLSAAMETAAKALSATPEGQAIILEEIKHHWKKARSYTELVGKGGPRSLFQIGNCVASTWENEMTNTDVTHAVKYKKEQGGTNKSDTSQDSAAPTYVYLAGMMAYGWSLEGLLNSHTKLMRALNPTICCAIQAFSARLAFDLSDWGSLCFNCSGYLRKRRQDDGSRDFDPQDKRRRVEPGTSERFSPGGSDSDPAATSHLIPLSTSSREECNERDLSDLSQLEALAVAAAQAGLFEDSVAHTDPLFPSYSQQSFIHSRSSSSMVRDMMNYDGTAGLSTAVNNSSQARISVGQRLADASDSNGRNCEAFRPGPPLHLWIGDDVAGRACEELYVDPLDLNLWAAQDLPSGPFELLQSDFDLDDGQTL